MKCKASATQGARHINEIGEPPSSAQRRNSPVQTVLQRSPSTSPHITSRDLCKKRYYLLGLMAI
ncbi:MAG: hypothetical protein ORN21_04980 [Methylophilaceae bacterium]|nr:hypothetical protein [Methylophilaceae bacterium]